MGWSELILAFVAFFLSHSVPVRPPLRPCLVAQLGARGFTLIYSALSLAILVWLIGAAGRAPYVQLWAWAPWHSWAALAVMLLACLIIALSIGRPNPFSFGGLHNDRFEPTRPGLVRLTRHPLLMALGLWASAHLIANGDLAHVILFGTFAIFAFFGGKLVDRRRRRAMGPRWTALWSQVGGLPLSKAVRPGPKTGARLACSLGLYVVLLGLHPVVIGVAPLP